MILKPVNYRGNTIEIRKLGTDRSIYKDGMLNPSRATYDFRINSSEWVMTDANTKDEAVQFAINRIETGSMYKSKKVERYHCPNCNAEDTLWPELKGRRKLYRCERCGATYWPSELDMYWGKSNQPTLTIIKE